MGRATVVLIQALALSACMPAMRITRNTVLSGTYQVRTVDISSGVVVAVSSDVHIVSAGSVRIAGDLIADATSHANIRISVSSGDCLVEGRLIAGAGLAGPNPGDSGGNGGSVKIDAPGEIHVTGSIESGSGGDGRDESVQGVGNVRAISGGGGEGGDIELAADTVLIEGPLSAGSGGDGGNAKAVVTPYQPDPERPFPEHFDPPADGSADALARSGGKGGSILLKSTNKHGYVGCAPVSIRAGDGGNTQFADAAGGKEGYATAEKPGVGGNVTVIQYALTTAGSGWSLEAGKGGKARALAEFAAYSVANDLARSDSAGGGEPGKVFINSSIIDQAFGGDAGNISAIVQTQKFKAGGAGSKGKPGPGGRVTAP